MGNFLFCRTRDGSFRFLARFDGNVDFSALALRTSKSISMTKISARDYSQLFGATKFQIIRLAILYVFGAQIYSIKSLQPLEQLIKQHIFLIIYN